jgi:hypothetical protein
VSRSSLIAILVASLAGGISAQTASQRQQPGVRVNYLNVCTPSEADAQEISAALALLPARASFATDFEVARGRSTMTDQPLPLNKNSLIADAPISNWVRLRREFVQGVPFSNVQYSFSMDTSGMTETLVFRARDVAKGDVLQISLQDTVTSGTAEAVLSSNTPVDRIRIERSGKSSLVVARCADADQSRFEGLFGKASQVMSSYRSLLDVKQTVPADLARLNTGAPRKGAAKKTLKSKKH